MKIIKMLCLAALAGLIVAAFGGVSSASATTLCKVNTYGTQCPEGSVYTLPTSLSADASKFELAGSPFNASCSSSSMTIKANKEEGGSISGEITELSLSNCSVFWCGAAEAVHLPYNVQITGSGSGDGTMKVTGSGKGNPAFQFHNCSKSGFKAECTWGAESMSFALDGGSPATLSTSTSLKLESGSPGVCTVGTWTWNASYETPGLEYSGNASSSSFVSGESFNTSCQSHIEGSRLRRSSGSISGLSFSSCTGTCSSAEAEHLSFPTTYAAGAEGAGALTVSSGGSGTARVRFSGCKILGLTVQCGYTVSSTLDVSAQGESGNTEIVANNEKVTRDGFSALCPKEATWSATYSTYGPGLWIE